MTAVVDRPVTVGPPRPADGEPPRRRRWSLRTLALLAGTVSIIGALLLPFAPVQVDDPVVTWPSVATAPRSTLLPLEAGTPLGLDAEFTCRAVSAVAAAGGERVLLATVRPDRPGPATGLRLVVDDSRLTAFLGPDEVFRDVVPAGPCRYRISTDGNRLGYSRDGLRLGGSALPTVDALITDLTALAGPDLTVTVRVDDRYAGSPAPVKVALLAVVAIGTCLAVGCLLAGRRRRPRRARPPRRFRVAPADAVVGAVLVAWLFLAPMTHDDGWMYAMALNERHAGYFGNYYMYFNNSYVPFTWLLQIYAWWAQLGVAPVLMRVPSLAFAAITWAAVRGTLGRVPPRRVAVAALLFLAWWLPFGLGTRQEASVAACLTVTVYAVTAARRRQRPTYLGLAVGAAALGLIAHPAGIVGVLPLLLAAPSSVRVIRRTSRTVLDGIATAVCVLACAAVAGIAGFADGSLDDFLRGKSSFGDADSADGAGAGALLAELDRYRSLLGDASIGNYAIRTPVLLLLLVLPFFLTLCAHARRRRPLPRTLWLTGWTCALGLGMLVLTPSKWTWHFGAFAGIATIFLACWAGTAHRLSTRLLDDRRGLLLGAGPAALALTAGWVVLSGQGRNWWADNLMPGVPRGGQPLLPAAAAVVAVVVVGAAGLWVWRHRGPRAAVPAAGLLVGCFLVGELTFLVGGFGVAVARTWDTWSPWTDSVQDPLAQRCGEGRVVSIADPDTAVGVPVWSGEPVLDRFAPGLRPTDSAPAPGPATAQVWGNLPARPDAPAHMRTPWLRLPAGLSADHLLMTTVSGSTGRGNELTAEFGTPVAGGPTAPDGMRVVATSHLAGSEDSGTWRDAAISDGGALPAGAVAFRLTATATHDRLVFAMPTVRRQVPVADVLPRDGRTLVDWQLTWLYPCLGRPPIEDGIVAPVSYVVAFGFGPDGSSFSATNGGTWTAEIGGMLGSQVRSSTVTRLYTVHGTEPGYPMRTVYRLTRPYADHAYLLQRTTSTSMGWRTPT